MMINLSPHHTHRSYVQHFEIAYVATAVEKLAVNTNDPVLLILLMRSTKNELSFRALRVCNNGLVWLAA